VQYPLPLRAEHVTGAKLFARREDMIRDLAERLRGGVIAELGVAFGDFSRFLIDELTPRRFDAFDVFTLHKSSGVYMGKDVQESLGGRAHLDHYRSRFSAEIEQKKLHVFVGDATKIKESDAIYDMIYVDADHSYEGVLADAHAAISRLKEDGILIFNDYIMADYIANFPYGVVQVVNELCVNQGWKIVALAIPHHRFDDVALVRA